MSGSTEGVGVAAWLVVWATAFFLLLTFFFATDFLAGAFFSIDSLTVFSGVTFSLSLSFSDIVCAWCYSVDYLILVSFCQDPDKASVGPGIAAG